MTTTASSSVFDSSSQAHDHEARLLGEILRTSRIVLLFGEAGSDNTALLKTGLMPLLRRRTGDRLAPAAAREAGVVIPFPDRRRRASASVSTRRREFIVYFDDWTDTPLAKLHACIHRAAATSPAEWAAPPVRRLSETLALLSSRLDANFIILFDRFEEFLQAPSHRQDIAQFADELVEAVNQAGLSASVLISLNEAARPALTGLRSRIPGFDDFSLKLTRRQGLKPAAAPVQNPEPPGAVVVGTLPTPTESVTVPERESTPPARTATAALAAHAVAAPVAKSHPPLPQPPVTTGEVYAFIEATLAHTATNVATESLPVDRARMDRGRVGSRAAAGASPTACAEANTRVVATAPASTGALGCEPHPRTRRVTLGAVVKWLGRYLRRQPKPGS